MKPKFTIGPTHCRCHPETCGHDPWTIYDEDGEPFDTYFRREDAEARILELNSLELLDKSVKAIKELKKQLKESQRQRDIALGFIINVKNRGDCQTGRRCANEAEDAYNKIFKLKVK